MKSFEFDYNKYKSQIINILSELGSIKNFSWSEYRKILAKYPKDGDKIFSKNNLISAYKRILESDNPEIKLNPTIFEWLLKKPTRTLSGVTTVTVLTKPYPCPGKCIFCPSESRMPKSYLHNEPGAQRAERNYFDPYLQTYRRLEALKNIGHSTQKVELIILGGTWTFYPENYQIWFIKRCFDAMNDFGASINQTEFVENELRSNNKLLDSEVSDWLNLTESQQKNEVGKCKCVGIVVETRPDEINEKISIHLRRLGCTKVQIGVQSLDNTVLKLNKRGHDLNQTKEAFRILRLTGFKIHAHWMPNLYGSNVEKDKDDFKKLFECEDFRPDELKIYPCSLIVNTELEGIYKQGKWKPYSYDELLDVLLFVFKSTPRYCRLTRIIRDIPAGDIVTGNKLSNFRQIVDKKLEEENVKSMEIRSREIRNTKLDTDDLQIKTTKYRTSSSTEFFLEYVTKDDKIAGFLRLSLPTNSNGNMYSKHPFIDELDGCAIIREVHVYGKTVDIGNKDAGKAQHLGLGTKLIQKAEELAKKNGFQKLAVISAVGTREYYGRQEYAKGERYMAKELKRGDASKLVA